MKVVYNACFGGFGLSHKAILRYAELKNLKIFRFETIYVGTETIYRRVSEDSTVSSFLTCYATVDKDNPTGQEINDTYFSYYDIERDDPALVQVVEELGAEANGDYAQLSIDDIPAGTAYRIDEYDGKEFVATMDSYDWKIAK